MKSDFVQVSFICIYRFFSIFTKDKWLEYSNKIFCIIYWTSRTFSLEQLRFNLGNSCLDNYLDTQWNAKYTNFFPQDNNKPNHKKVANIFFQNHGWLPEYLNLEMHDKNNYK